MAAQLQRRLSGKHPKRLMGRRVIMVVIKDAVAPVRRPAMIGKQSLELLGQVLALAFQRTVINDNR